MCSSGVLHDPGAADAGHSTSSGSSSADHSEARSGFSATECSAEISLTQKRAWEEAQAFYALRSNLCGKGSGGRAQPRSE